MKQFLKPYTGTIYELLRDFFGYFSKFDYNTSVVCPLLGNTIPKTLFLENKGQKLPPEMTNYIARIQSDDGEMFRANSPFCIQDPFDLSHNLTKACNFGNINEFTGICTLTFELLQSLE